MPDIGSVMARIRLDPTPRDMAEARLIGLCKLLRLPVQRWEDAWVERMVDTRVTVDIVPAKP